MQESVLGGEPPRKTKIAATADTVGRPPFSAPSRDSCSHQVNGSLEEVDQESKRVTHTDAA
jgi:hypothetical protein